MKNPFHFFRLKGAEDAPPSKELDLKTADLADTPTDSEETTDTEQAVSSEPIDRFEEWCRSVTTGGIERRERNDIFEMYHVYGTEDGSLICRRYHRYPEHERQFSLSYSRSLNFDEFNRRLLTELDKDAVSLSDYCLCMKRSEELTHQSPVGSCYTYDSFSEEEQGALVSFCEGLDNLREVSCHLNGSFFCCEGMSAVGEESISLRFRRILPHDALFHEVPGVLKEKIDGFDIENIWILGIYNRLYESCDAVSIFRLTYTWSLSKDSVLLFSVEGLGDIKGELLAAVSESGVMSRFGFCSLDFSGR